MASITKDLLDKFTKLKEVKGGEITIEDIDKILTELVGLIEKHAREDYTHIIKKIQLISDRIEQTKIDISEDPVAGAQEELDSIVVSTEEATETIIDAVEKIQKQAEESKDEGLVAVIDEEANKIYEACNFQDLTGQRVKKIATALDYVEKTVGELIAKKAQEDASAEQSLENGPQKHKCAPSQEDIDKLFDSI